MIFSASTLFGLSSARPACAPPRRAIVLDARTESAEDVEVRTITRAAAEAFVTKKHYSRRASMLSRAFGLFEHGALQGVVVYGLAPRQIEKHSFTVDRQFPILELTRLVVQTKARNAASLLVGRSLALLPKPCVVVSYADTEQAHCGIVYQATNWLYTGATTSHDHMYIIDGKRTHPRSLTKKGITSPKQWAKENGIETVAPMQKHRYFFFCGDKREKKAMRAALKYPVLDRYPKCDQRRYDDGPDIHMTVSEAAA